MIISSLKFVFPQFTSSSCLISFLSSVKMNSTNWPALNVWVFIAQLVRAYCSNNTEAMGLNPVEVLQFFWGGGGVNLLLLNLKLALGRSYLHLNLYLCRSHHLYESYEWLTKFVNHDFFNQEYNNITDQIGWHKVLLPIIKTTCITKLIVIC